jgi:hypothetical protein
MSNADIKAEAAQLGVDIAARQGRLALLAGEMDRRLAWAEDGATSMAAWVSERHGVSNSSGRVLARLGERLWDLPHLARAFECGDISLDKVRAVIGHATPETDAAMTARAKECSVRELHALARDAQGVSDDTAASQHEARYLRFNDQRRTINVQLPALEYAMARATLEEQARALPSDGETRWDHRLHDAFVNLLRRRGAGTSNRPHLLVAHVDFASWRAGTATGDLERHGLISPEAVRRLTCDGEVVVALDDALGHTMYEGRAKRFPTESQRREVRRRDRECRFPGCAGATFTNVHHIVPWDPVGLTDLPNLVLLCEFHHHKVHEKGWRVEGDANGVLDFVTPEGRRLRSLPSPRWTRSDANA